MLLANVCAGRGSVAVLVYQFCWFTPSCLQNQGYAGVPIAGHAHWTEVGGGIVFVALWEFTGFHLNAPVAQRVITTEGSVVIGSVVKTI